MNDTEKARFNAPLDLVQWLDARIAQQVEHRLEQRLAQEREYLRCHVVDLIAAEREQVVAVFEKACRKLIDRVEAENEKLFDLVEWNQAQSNKLIAKVTESVDRMFDRLEAALDQYATAGMCRPDDDSQPPPSTH
jgi:hypothetical protein